MIQSSIFKFEQLKSEYRGTQWTIFVFVGAFAIYLCRLFMFGVTEDRALVGLKALLFGGAVLYEVARWIYIRRSKAAGRLLPEWLEVVDTVLEAAFPSFILLLLTTQPSVGPYVALVYPIRALNFFLIALSILHLKPVLSFLSGTVAAGSHALVVAWTFHAYPIANYPHAPFIDAPHYFTYAILLFFFGLTATVIARELQNSVVTALTEMHERQRIQLSTRNTLIFGLAKLAEYRDSDTGTHLERISIYSAILGQALRSKIAHIDEEWIDNLRVASSMHDIGKVGIPDGVLLKPGLLTDDERKVIQKHPDLGNDTLAAILERHGKDPLLEMSSDITVGHHERWDGKGYPSGIAGEKIPLAARIISVADVYDALTSKRVYKPAMSHMEAAKIIQGNSGTQFDPMVVEAFARSLQEFDEVRTKFYGK